MKSIKLAKFQTQSLVFLDFQGQNCAWDGTLLNVFIWGGSEFSWMGGNWGLGIEGFIIKL